MTQGRYFRPKPASLKGTPYDSLTEQRLHKGILKRQEHHPSPIPYVWEHFYEPDFVIISDKVYYVEVKGYFQDRNDCAKYDWVRHSFADSWDNIELVFVFEQPHKPMHFQKLRKDGTKMTHAEWAEKNGFRWFTEESIGELINETNN